MQCVHTVMFAYKGDSLKVIDYIIFDCDHQMSVDTTSLS